MLILEISQNVDNLFLELSRCDREIASLSPARAMVAWNLEL